MKFNDIHSMSDDMIRVLFGVIFLLFDTDDRSLTLWDTYYFLLRKENSSECLCGIGPIQTSL